jgi:hypothetical protein
MSDSKNILESYREIIQRPKDDVSIIASARSRFEERFQKARAERASSKQWLIPLFAAATAAAVTFIVLRPAPPPPTEAPLTASVRGKPGQGYEFVGVFDAEEEIIDFSDGSEVAVRPDSQIRVQSITANGAAVSLERGSAHVSVVHREKTQWSFAAGPYRVAVIGTKFELKWNPDTGGMEVTMDDGVVEVEGPGLRRQRIVSKQKLEAFAYPPSSAISDVIETPPEPEVVAKVEEPEPAPSRSAKKKFGTAKPVPSGPTWRYLADKGDAKGAMWAADQAGFTWLLNSMPKADVLLLGDTARAARDTVHATEAWLAVRSRFRGTPEANLAAIKLGSLAAEFQRNDALAQTWFARAVAESPNGPHSQTAMGLWLQSLVRSGSASKAKQVASDYLKRFPNGDQAETAQNLVR